MILVNLLPQEFRRLERFSQYPWMKPRVIKGGAVFFFLLTAIFYIQNQFQLNVYKGLQGSWPSVYAGAQRVAQTKNEIEVGIKAERDFIQQYLASPIPATKILSAVSELLPETMWLVELKISRDPKENILFLKGLSHPFQGRSGIQDIEDYFKVLKQRFPTDAHLALTTSRQEREQMDLTYFTAVLKWT